MKSNVKFVILLIITALISSTAFFFFPEVNAAGLGYVVAIAFAASITQLLAVWYFLSSLKTFKRGLRTAYYWVAAGIFLFSFVLLIPSISIFWPVIQSSTVVNSILFLTPFTLGALGMYVGMRKFAKLLGSRHRLGSFWLVILIAAAGAGIVMLLPHPPVAETELVFDLTFGSLAWSGIFGIAAMVMALHIRQIIGPVYRQAMLWVAVAFALLAATSFQELIVKIYFLDSAYVAHQVSLVWLLLVGILFLKGGIAFKETSRESIQLSPDASYTDIVTGVAQLVSKPAEVDKELDKLRTITAQQGQTDTQQNLSSADKNTLTEVYLYLEDYLVTKESLHTFTKEGLRNGLPDYFVQELKTHQ